MAKKKGGKKGKGKKEAFEFTPEALAPFDCKVNDIIATPLGVQCTVHGVKGGALFLKWPGGLISPATTAPLKVKDKDGLAEYGYNKRPESAHIQRSLDERAKAEYEHRRCTDPPANRTREELMLHDYVVVLLLARFVLLDLTHSCSLLHMVFCRQTTSPHRRPRTCASRLGPPDRKVRFGTKRTRPNAKTQARF